MFATPEKLAAWNKANVETMLTLANTGFAGVERLAALNLNTTRSALEEGVANVKALLGVKDMQEMMNLQSAWAQPALEKVVAYWRSVYEISTQTQEEFAKVFEAQYADFNKSVAAALENAAKSAPAGSEVAVAAVKSALTAANSVFDNMSKAAKQVADIAEANVTAATNATVKAVGVAANAPKAKKVA